MALRILVVEDDPVSSDVLASLLSVCGHLVDIAEDGFRAVRLAQDTAYDLVFVDYHLPEMDGYALARLLRSTDRGAHGYLGMVALTGDRSGLAARRGADTLFDRILAKPIEPEELFALTEAIESARPSTRHLDKSLAEPTPADAISVSAVLWRTRGLADAPAAAALPAPSAVERARLSCCFRLVPVEQADCILLLGPEGVAELEAARQTGKAHLVPVFALDPELARCSEAVFSIGDGESWSQVATALDAFAGRRARLSPELLAAEALDERLLASLYVGDRDLTLRRDPLGANDVEGAGFPAGLVLEAIRRLVAKGMLVATQARAGADGARELKVVLSALAVESLTRRPLTSGRQR